MTTVQDNRPAVSGGALAALAAALAVAVLIDAVAGISVHGVPGLLSVPGGVVVAGAALLATRVPVVGGLLACAALVGSTGIPVLLGYVEESVPAGLPLPGVGYAETLGGAVLVVLIVWLSRPLLSAPLVTVLVGTTLTVFVGRASLLDGLTLGASGAQQRLARGLVVGFVLLIATVTAGLALRRQDRLRHPTVYRHATALDGQWPVIVGLGGLLLMEAVITVSSNPPGLIAVLFSVAVGGLAVLGPRDPVRISYGAAAVFVVGIPFAVVTIASSAPVPFGGIAALLVLSTLVVRRAEPSSAAKACAALAAAAVLATAARSDSGGLGSRLTVSMLPVAVGFAVAVGVGIYLRGRDEDRARSAAATMRTARQSERLALARELHDIVAHHVTGIVVQANAVRTVVEPGPAHEALGRIADSGAEALVAMRRLVGRLRGPEGETGPDGATVDLELDRATADLADDLRAVAERATVPTHLDLDVPPGLSATTARSVLRLVTEAITNSGKHAAEATLVTVYVGPSDGGVSVRVADDGSGARLVPPGGSGGYGLIGMTERVELLGGRFSAGPTDYGWRVDAWLPIDDPQEAAR